jgi:hypothetical protein
MKHALFTTLFLTVLTANAAESPYDKFSAKNNFTDKTSVKWIQVDNINVGCNIESRKRGLPEYNKPIDGCSFWDKTLFGNTCLIVTPKHVDYWTFGHELRHCFQGGFHKE